MCLCDGQIDLLPLGVFDGEHLHAFAAERGFDNAEIFADAVFHVHHEIPGLYIGGFRYALLLLVEPLGGPGVGAAVGVVGVEIALGDDQDFAGMVNGAFVQYAVMELEAIRNPQDPRRVRRSASVFPWCSKKKWISTRWKSRRSAVRQTGGAPVRRPWDADRTNGLEVGVIEAVASF